MVRPRKEGSSEETNGDSYDRLDQSNEDSDDSSQVNGSGSSGAPFDDRSGEGAAGGLPVRVSEFREEADLYPLLGGVGIGKGFMQWLRALDLQFMGGCRMDERLKPLLKLNASSGAAEDQLMSRLIQHFEASEVAVLARCLCVPLVSVRVGKIYKQGTMLCPTSLRGFLSLTLLPSSAMRLTFTGDDGCIERLALISNDFECFSVIIEVISADPSGRSFLLKISNTQILFFWCSEKSKVHGMELIEKVKDLLQRKPSLSDLTGISEQRLDSFATHLWSYLSGSANNIVSSPISSSSSLMTASDLHSSETDFGCCSKPSRNRMTAAHGGKVHPPYQSSLSPRSNTFKDGTPRSYSTKNGGREKVRKRGESSINVHSSSISTSHDIPSQNHPESHGSHGLVLPTVSSLPSALFSLSSALTIPSRFSNQSSFFSPHYCWCPPRPSSLQYNTSTHQLSSSGSSTLPPFPTLLSAAASPETLVTSKFQINANELPPLLPSIFPGPLVHLSRPIPSICPLPNSQIPTFTPFMSDPIVHIPVINVCSSGQGYLVSAGPTISGAIPALPISHVGPQLIPPTESPVEKSARETLRMLMASTPVTATPKLFNILPDVFSSMEPCGNGNSEPIGGRLNRAVDTVSITAGISLLELSLVGDVDDKVSINDLKMATDELLDDLESDGT
ncbi:hypothetical protein HPP92_018194 [Vanilla planifolia]|uniref:Flocculation protein n=1 Tax=Vanilla planifolia TaxID=51239 RepID=A0A835UKK9_VANPL|nr:hypothetical protein HPP92_018194 [Vanilla planifolia]